MPYIDNVTSLLQVSNAIPEAQTAKIAITRPTTRFEIITADNPDMVRTLQQQELFVKSELDKETNLLTPQQIEQKRKELIRQYQSSLSEKAFQEQQGLLKAMKAQGIPTMALLEDKGRLETAEFDYYSEQIFATDTGQYCTVQACVFIKTRLQLTEEKMVALFKKLNGHTGIILVENKIYYANQKDKTITEINTQTISSAQLTKLKNFFPAENEQSVTKVENEVISLVESITGQPVEDKLLYIQANFKNQQRKDEERLAAAQATNIGAKTLNLLDENGQPLIFEGGDIRQMPGKKLFFVGQGHRTQAQASKAIAAATGYIVIPIHLQQEQFYHLDCCFLPLPNDAAVIYEGGYKLDDEGNKLLDEHGWPLIVAGTETMTATDRLLIRTLYNSDKLILITKAEALAFATNAAVLQSPSDNRFKLFTNGNRDESIVDEKEAIKTHKISFTSKHIEEMKKITNGKMDIIEVPYSTMHGSGGSVRCTVQEVACTTASLSMHKINPYHFSETIEKLENHLSSSLICKNRLFKAPTKANLALEENITKASTNSISI